MTGWTVFLDRDGVFNPQPAITIRRPAGYRFIPGAKEAFARLNRPDVRTCLVTNQPFAILALNVRGLRRVHEHLRSELAAAGGRLDRIEASWGLPFVPHRRRKPRPGMLQDAARVLGAVPERSFMVGDKPKDAQAAAAFGCPAFLVTTTHTREELERGLRRTGTPATIVGSLGEAVDLILAAMRNG
jgi:D-glycero-D-manno-heptose 1,7-bisphosphate phosphatase